MKHKNLAISLAIFLFFIGGMVVYSSIYAPHGPASITFIDVTPTNAIYSYSSIPVVLSTNVTGGSLDKIWYNCMNGSSWIYVSNQTYTTHDYVSNFMNNFDNGTNYTFYAWANATDGTLAQSTKTFSVVRTSTHVMLVTSMGNITIELFDDMPITSGNFKNLTQFGVYNGTIFHRVATSPAIIQGGGVNSAGNSVMAMAIQDELPNKHSNLRGTVAMAKTSSPNSATSQFYINVQDNTSLDSNYTVFGNVTAGMDIVDLISKVPLVSGSEKPQNNVVITQAIVLT